MAMDKATQHQMRQDWVDGVHIRDMMRKYGCSKGVLSGIGRRASWPTRDYVRDASQFAMPSDEYPRGPEHISGRNEPEIDSAAIRAHDIRALSPGRPTRKVSPFDNLAARPVVRPILVKRPISTTKRCQFIIGNWKRGQVPMFCDQPSVEGYSWCENCCKTVFTDWRDRPPVIA